MHDLNFIPWRENNQRYKNISQLKRPIGLLLLIAITFGLIHTWLNHLCNQRLQKNNQIQRSLQSFSLQEDRYQQLLQQCVQLQQSLHQLLQYRFERYQLTVLLNSIFLKWPPSVTLKKLAQQPGVITLEIIVPTQTSVNDWIAQLRQLPSIKNVHTTIITAASNTTVMLITLTPGNCDNDLSI
ncbi:MAG: hypothetical protein A2X77_04890 [Gammaproteobacteria bacterium GWE2_42_36]|nr:MAG: hypothetical protein A2X77_04890 [Gammaproteobacteria bacterium GWE2_42_36]HCU05383.1 hypothetical protein [Coxiellaceae bacterium]